MNNNGKILIVSAAIITLAIVCLAAFGVFTASAAKGGKDKPVFCTDSDNGINYYEQGLCSGKNGDFLDYCTGSVCNEYYCDSRNRCVTTLKDCQDFSGNGTDWTCHNGACQELPQNNCTDSDGGMNYLLKGTCLDNTGDYTDYCEGDVCNEYYCNYYNLCAMNPMNCNINGSNGTCYDGACVY